MGGYYDEIEIEDMTWDPVAKVFHYPCPCGDRFEISRGQLAECEDIATCPSCSLIIRVIFDPLDFEDEPPSDEEESASSDEDTKEEEDDDEADSASEEAFEDALENLKIDDVASDESSVDGTFVVRRMDDMVGIGVRKGDRRGGGGVGDGGDDVGSGGGIGGE